MRRLMGFVIALSIVGGVGPLAGVAAAGSPSPSPAVVAPQSSCLTLPEINRLRQKIADQAVKTEAPVETYRIEVARAGNALAGASENCIAGVRTALLETSDEHFLVRLDSADTGGGNVGDVGQFDPGGWSGIFDGPTSFGFSVPSPAQTVGILIGITGTVFNNRTLQVFGAVVTAISPPGTTVTVNLGGGQGGGGTGGGTGSGGTSAGDREQ